MTAVIGRYYYELGDELNSRKKIIKDSVAVLFVRVVGTLLALALSVVLARILGSDGYGVYSFALSILMLLALPIQAGFPNLAVRETARSLVENNVHHIHSMQAWMLKLIISYFVVISSILIFLIYFSSEWVESTRFQVILYGYLIVPLVAVVAMQTSMIRGFGNVVVAAMPDSLLRPGVSLVILGGTFMIFPSYVFTPFYAIVIYTVAVASGFVLSYIFLRNLLKRKLLPSIEGIGPEKSKWLSSLYPLTIVGGVQLLFGYADVVILGLFRSDSEVGVYRVAVQIGGLVVFGLTVLNQMIHPYIARLYAESKMETLQRLVVISSRVIFLLAAIPALLLYIAGDYLIEYAIGKEYLIGFVALKIIILGQLVNAALGSVSSLLNMTGNEKDSMRGMLIALVLNIVLNFLLIPSFGMEGAAISSAVSLILWNAILRYFVKARLGIESSGLVYLGRQKVLRDNS